MIGQYLGRVLHFAFAKFVLRTDGMQVIAAVAIPVLAGKVGLPHQSDISSVMMVWIAYFSVSLLAIRFVSAPYFVWREERERADRLVVVLKSPEHKIAEKMAERRAQVMADISRAVSEIVTHFGTDGCGDLTAKDAHNMMSLMFEANFHPELMQAIGAFHMVITADKTDKTEHYNMLKQSAFAVLQVIHRV